MLLLIPAAATAQTAPTDRTAPVRKVPSPVEAAVSEAPAAPAATTFPPEAIGDGPTVGGYNFVRWAEDWSAMRDPAKRHDWIDRLKYLPIGGDRAYLTLSGEMRVRTDLTTNPGLREAPTVRQDTDRATFGADLHVGRHLRFYLEGQHRGLGGRRVGEVPKGIRDQLLKKQSFAEARTDIAHVTLGARYGQQEFSDGPDQLVSSRDNNTVRFVLRGWRGWAYAPRARVDLFDMHFTAFGSRGARDDGPDDIEDSNRFTGVTGGIALPKNLVGKGQIYIDPFLWRLRSNGAIWAAHTGREERSYIGVHVWGTAGRATIDWTVNRQGGRFDRRPIRAWQLLLAQTMALSDAKTAPKLGVHFDYASGGGAYGTGTLRNAYSPYGNNAYYSFQGATTPTNLIAVAPNLTLLPVKPLRLVAEHVWSWKATTGDAIYRSSGAPFTGTERVSATKAGETTRLQMVYSFTPRLTLIARYEHVAAGPALTEAGYTNSDLVTSYLNFKF